MPKKQDIVSEQLDELKQDLRDLWVALTKDPKKQARKERTWTILAGVFAAVGTVASRKLATKIWGVLTGEAPPATQKAREEAAREAHEEAVETARPPTEATTRG